MTLTTPITDKMLNRDNPENRSFCKKSLIGMPKSALAEALATAGIPENKCNMRKNQIWHWIYKHGASDFEAMNNVAKDVKTALNENYDFSLPECVSEQISVDGTRKWLLKLQGETPERFHLIETVYIPETDRGTLCVSSQVGCTLTCTFCHTGTQKLVRNLTAQEIVAQVMFAKHRLFDWAPHQRPDTMIVPSGTQALTNIVFMGMGEPLFNTDNVIEAITVLTDDSGLDFSKRKITVSTSGVVPDIARIGAETGVMLAISLHAVNDTLRNKLVPINRKYNLETLLNACAQYPGLSNSRRITFEYVMLNGVNDSDNDAKELVRLLKGIPSKINLIPFNSWPGSNYTCSTPERIEAFSDYVNKAGYASPVRRPRGQDILAACGQLKSATERLSSHEIKALNGA